ncbi:putative reverse transcriptase domain-containing protein, partial [Tanacetum coccineum]
GYYRRFIANFSKIAKPLTLLTQKNQKFKWGDEQENTFQTLKDMLCDAPILALPEGTDDFVVYCDASNQGFSCVLMQRNKARILEAQSEASKVINTPAERLRGFEKQLERKEDNEFQSRTSETLRIALMARDIREEMGEDHYGLPNREDYKMEIFSRLYINEIVARHGVPVSIIYDRDSQEAEKEWDSYCKSSLESPTRTKTYLRTRRRDEAKVSATVRERYGLGRATEISG